MVEVLGPKIIDRSIVQKTLKKAIKSTCERFSNFCGILIYGSFVREEKPFGDIDIIPVLYRYNDNWDFSSLCEDCLEHNQDYYDYQEIEKYLGDQMYPLPQGFDKPIKETRKIIFRNKEREKNNFFSLFYQNFCFLTLFLFYFNFFCFLDTIHPLRRKKLFLNFT